MEGSPLKLEKVPVDFTLQEHSDGYHIYDLRDHDVGVISKELGVQIADFLEIQKKAFNSHDPVGKKYDGTDRINHTVEYAWHNKSGLSERKNVIESNCHMTARQLLPEADDRKFDVDYEVLSDSELIKKIKEGNPPLLVKCGWKENEKYRSITDQHSFVVLANHEDHTVCFQKFGYGYQYELISLGEILYYWRDAARYHEKDLLWKVIQS